MNSFDESVRSALGDSLRSAAVQTIQVNLGLLCNLKCRHCHVEASPQRTEVMTWQTMESILRLGAAIPEARVDLTGGAPELNPYFRPFVDALLEQGHTVQVRTNLSVFFENGQEDTPEYLAERHIHLIASLPCYLNDNVDSQRGAGVYKRSIASLRRLNALGYGKMEKLPLNLVYNPSGAFLPPDQTTLEASYRRELHERFNVAFSRLLAITNMPLGRFFKDLHQAGESEDYRLLLENSFNASTIEDLMCRHQICIAWNGALSDCDFNSALGLSLSEGLPHHIDDLEPSVLSGRKIVTGEHCYGCTAGCGSSCGGALVA